MQQQCNKYLRKCTIEIALLLRFDSAFENCNGGESRKTQLKVAGKWIRKTVERVEKLS
jgi:hypothetical protein